MQACDPQADHSALVTALEALAREPLVKAAGS
jgi:hypothetical protein